MASSNMTMEHMMKLFNDLDPKRKRKPIKPSIIKRVYKELNKIPKIRYKKKKYENIYWGDNPYTDDCLTIDLPHIELDSITPVPRDFINTVVFYDEKDIKREGIKYVEDSCLISYKGEIMCVYITEKDDKAITKATERIATLVDKMDKYYPVKQDTFYSAFKLTKTGASKEDKAAAAKLKKDATAVAKYTGKNWMDGMIRYFLGAKNKQGGTIISYQPRAVEAEDDDEFMFDLVYTYCALYELEKRYAPAIAKYRLELATDANYVGAFPGVPLSRHCATGMGASLDFASAIHNDSGISGLSETIIWNLPEEGMKQYFISPTIKLVFDLSKYKALIFQPPKIPHSTVSTGAHRGVGLVNITKANIVATTELNQKWMNIWNRYLNK